MQIRVLLLACASAAASVAHGGSVWEGALIDGDGAPVAAAVLYDLQGRCLDVENNEIALPEGVARAATDRAGRFRIETREVPAWLLARDFADRFALLPVDRTVDPPAPLVFREPGGLTGRLVEVDRPLAGVEVTAALQTDAEGIRYRCRALTDTNGVFSFDGLIPGTYSVHVLEEVPQVGCCFRAVLTRQETVEVPSGGTARVALGGSDLPYLAGQVRSAEGKPLHGVWVHLLPAEPREGFRDVLSCVTDPEGRYVIGDIPPGDYRLHCYRRLARESGSRVLEDSFPVSVTDGPEGTRPRRNAFDVEIDLGAFMPLARGEPVPEIDAADLDGGAIRLSELRGRVVVLYFMASWCPPCVHNVDRIEQLSRRLGDDVAVIGISLDADASAARDFVRAHHLTFPVILNGPMNDASLAARYRVTSLPTSFVIDQAGALAQTDLFGATLEKYIRDKLLR